MCSCLDPMAQRIPMQDESPPQMDPEPEMGAAAVEAAVYDTSPPPLYQNPPIPAETVRPGAFDMAQFVAMLKETENNIIANINANIEVNMKKMIKNNTQAFRNDARALRGEMRQVGQCLQAGIMATPRVATNELRGSASGRAV